MSGKSPLAHARMPTGGSNWRPSPFQPARIRALEDSTRKNAHTCLSNPEPQTPNARRTTAPRSGGPKGAQRPLARPLDGAVRRESVCTSLAGTPRPSGNPGTVVRAARPLAVGSPPVPLAAVNRAGSACLLNEAPVRLFACQFLVAWRSSVSEVHGLSVRNRCRNQLARANAHRANSRNERNTHQANSGCRHQARQEGICPPRAAGI